MAGGAVRLRIAVVGGGVAGLTAAHLLQRRHEVTLFDGNDYAGGHTNTVEIPAGPDRGTPVDTGFIVCNNRTYPLFNRMLDELGVARRKSEMSFAYASEDTGLQYSGSDLNGLFAQRANLVRPAFWRMVRDVLRFFETARADLQEDRVGPVTLGEYLDAGGYRREFIDEHLVPMGAAIWSTPPGRMLEFPAATFLRFFSNHGLLAVRDRPQWMTVAGGSRTYVRRILDGFRGTVRLGCAVRGVVRTVGGVDIAAGSSGPERYDAVVIAAHADEALSMLADPSDAERRLLGAWTYTHNDTVLHTDASVMPSNRRAWSSWNYVREKGAGPGAPATLSYWMNRLQGLQTAEPVFVTLNRRRPIDPSRILRRFDYTHPMYTFEALRSQSGLPTLQGVRSTWYCGSYFGYGFHEDAVRSAVAVARDFDCDPGWGA